MAQFRLTKKFATDIKVDRLGSPCLVTSIFDDWFIDVFRVQRKKVAMVTHAKSLLTFILPYEHIGGSKSVPDCISVLLEEFLTDNELNFDPFLIEQTFSSPPVFCKTDDKRVLGHMNDFKQCIKARMTYDDLKFCDIDWDDIMSAINNMPVGNNGFKYASELAKELFSKTSVNHV